MKPVNLKTLCFLLLLIQQFYAAFFLPSWTIAVEQAIIRSVRTSLAPGDYLHWYVLSAQATYSAALYNLHYCVCCALLMSTCSSLWLVVRQLDTKNKRQTVQFTCLNVSGPPAWLNRLDPASNRLSHAGGPTKQALLYYYSIKPIALTWQP